MKKKLKLKVAVEDEEMRFIFHLRSRKMIFCSFYYREKKRLIMTMIIKIINEEG